MKKWNILYHTAASALFGTLIQLLSGLTNTRQAASIGVIGSADGPTAIFVAGKSTLLDNAPILQLLISVFRPGILGFILAMMLYIPVKRLIGKNK